MENIKRKITNQYVSVAKWTMPFLYCAILITLISPSLAHAEDNPSALGVSPAIFEKILTPGEPTQMDITVFNFTDIPLPIKSSVANFIDVPEDMSDAQRKIFDVTEWFTIDEPDFILQPRQQKKVRVTIDPPVNAEAGGHYATIYFQPLIPKEVLSPDNLYVSSRVGVLSFLVIKGDINESLKVTHFETTSFQQFGPMKFSLSIENTGNMHSLPSGSIVIKNMLGKEVIQIPIDKGFILPTLTKDYTHYWERTLLFGKYTARFVGTYGTETKSIESDLVSFWVIPYVPLLIIGVPFTLFLILLITARKRLGKAWDALRGRDVK